MGEGGEATKGGQETVRGQPREEVMPDTVSKGTGDAGQGRLKLLQEVVERIPGGTLEGDGVRRGGAAGGPLGTPDTEGSGRRRHHAGTTASGNTDASELEATGGESTRRATDAGRDTGRREGGGVRRVVEVTAGASSSISRKGGCGCTAGQRREVSGVGAGCSASQEVGQAD